MAATPEHAARVLGLDDNATLKDVRRVRREMALKYHPDRSHDQERATRHMARINAAADTLTAHLKKQAAPASKAKRPEGPDFSARSKPEQSTPRPDPSNRKATSSKTGVHKGKPDPARTPRPAVREPVARARVSSAKEHADLALIRFASESYRKVLNRISQIDTGPRVDVTALSFLNTP